MGAEQSSTRPEGQNTSVTQKICYYELLGLDSHAADEDIRRAYKRKALELHPDRNLGDTDNATRKFAEVQTAYEILSDPQERAWYDSHRDAILRGDQDIHDDSPSEHYNVRITSTEELFTLMGRFNSSVPFTDSPTGFFGILETIFAQLALEEQAAGDWHGQATPDYPPFGSSKDGYDAVAKLFYNTWSGFSTKKTFSWKNKYRLSDAPDRRIRRLMEKENKKLRDDAIREFNDAVRSLVAFVKKRDPRYVPNTQSEVERQKVLRDSAAAQAARSRAANQQKMAEFVVPKWAESSNAYDDHLSEFSLSEDESEVEQIECVVCKKTFKSEKQYAAHEKSKKHTKAVQQLRREMRRENKDLELNNMHNAGEEEQPASAVPSDDKAESDRLDESSHSVAENSDQGTSTTASTEDSSDGDEYAPREVVQDRLDSRGVRDEGHDLNKAADAMVAGASGLDLGESSKRIGKAKTKRDKKAARPNAAADINGCSVCQESFPSRTKLFDHIRKEGHAAPVMQKAAKGGKKHKK